jgi:hypothetical protein
MEEMFINQSSFSIQSPQSRRLRNLTWLFLDDLVLFIPSKTNHLRNVPSCMHSRCRRQGKSHTTEIMTDQEGIQPTSEQLIDGFLREAYSAYPEASQDLCIIITKDKSAYQHDESDPTPSEARRSAPVQTQGGGPMRTPSRPPWSMDLRPPFLGQSPEEVANFLSKGFNDTLLETGCCAIIDEESLQDGSALLVVQKGGHQDDGGPNLIAVRLPFAEINAALGCYSVGELDPEDHLASDAPWH